MRPALWRQAAHRLRESDEEFWMPSWDVQYEVRSGIDNHETVMSSGTVTVDAADAEQAQRAAVGVVHDTDTAADERLDPQVIILNVAEAA